MSVVIPAHNAAKTIGAQLAALGRQEWDGTWEVLVADNNSTDDTVAAVAHAANSDLRVRLIDAGGQRGPSFARNTAVAAARGRSIAFCDADDVVGDHWVAAMGGALRHHAFVTGPQEQELLNPPCLRDVYGSKSGVALQSFSGIFPFGPSANLGIRRQLFEELGGFDVSLEVGEDLDLCMRLWLEGVELRFEPNALVHYRHRQPLRSLFSQAVSYGAAAPEIGRRLRTLGRPAPSRWSGVKNWVWLARRLPSVRSLSGRARWLVVAGNSVGRLRGSVRSRSLML